jgi:hypothetical protein
MQLASLLDMNLPHWQSIAIPAAGLVAAFLTVMLGRFVQLRWRSRAARAESAAADAPDRPHDPFEKGSITEQRQGVRRKGNPIEVLISDPEAEEAPVRGWVLDRSVNGLCLLVDEEIAVGTVLSVKPRQSPPGMPWIRAEVRNCKKDNTGYQAGCQFVSTPPWGILLLFG